MEEERKENKVLEDGVKENTPTGNRKNKNIILIIVICIIGILVGIVWWISNNEEQELIAQQQENSNLEYPLHITSLDVEELKQKGLPMILDFGSDSCVPCVEMAPELEKVNLDYQGKAIITFADVWKYPELAQGFPISVIPTQIFINADGTPYNPSEEILNAIPGFQLYVTQDTEELVYTAHQGGLTEEQMRIILAEMGATTL